MEIRYLLDKLKLLEAEQLLAPNGKPSNLNPVQYQQVRTPAFKAWFGDSKVVDENGEPLVVYNGSPSDFDEYDRDKVSPGFYTFDGGFYFSSDTQVASDYAKRENGNVKPMFLSIKNPVIVDEPEEFLRDLIKKHGTDGARYARIEVEKAGHDGLYYPTIGTYVAFKSNQAKSAIGNTGSFSQQSNKIHENR